MKGNSNVLVWTYDMEAGVLELIPKLEEVYGRYPSEILVEGEF